MKRHIGIHYLNHPKHLFFTLAFIAGGVFGIVYSVQAYPELFKTEVFMSNASEIKPDDSVAVDFSNPVFQDGYADIQVREENDSPDQKEDISVFWENSNRKLVIKPKYLWKVGSRYKIILPEGRNKMFIEVPSQELGFSTIKFPKIKSISPSNGEKDVVLEIEDPITVDFEESTENFSVKFSMEPQSELTYRTSENKTQFKILPKEKMKEGTLYTVKAYIKYISDKEENYKEIFSSSFTTKPPASSTWEKDFTLRLEQAKKFTPAQITSGKYVDINLSQQIMCTFEDGKLLDCYLVSTGKRGMETPKGQFSIRNKAVRVWSKKYGLYMPYWNAVASDGSFGIHELPEWPGGYKEGANHLGTPVSHGCIRLGVGPAKIVFDWADIGTPVVIY